MHALIRINASPDPQITNQAVRVGRLQTEEDRNASQDAGQAGKHVNKRMDVPLPFGGRGSSRLTCVRVCVFACLRVCVFVCMRLCIIARKCAGRQAKLDSKLTIPCVSPTRKPAHPATAVKQGKKSHSCACNRNRKSSLRGHLHHQPQRRRALEKGQLNLVTDLMTAKDVKKSA